METMARYSDDRATGNVSSVGEWVLLGIMNKWLVNVKLFALASSQRLHGPYPKFRLILTRFHYRLWNEKYLW